MERDVEGWKKKVGALGEKVAEEYLSETEGYLVLHKNYRCPLGEIDLICKDGDYLVFVEVRSSTRQSVNMAAESINYRKQRKLKQLASYYLWEKGLSYHLCRFDVLLLLLDAEKEKAQEKRFLKNAFF